jgi:hypothetical protein
MCIVLYFCNNSSKAIPEKIISIEMLKNNEYAKPKEKLVFLSNFNQKNGYSMKGK